MSRLAPALIAIIVVACSSESTDDPTPDGDAGSDGGVTVENDSGTIIPVTDGSVEDSGPVAGEEVIVGAGDIAVCESGTKPANTVAAKTAALVKAIPGTVLLFGDNAYEMGTTAQFSTCFDPTWGQFKARSKPSVGNHEYMTANAAPYYAYFGAAAGDPKKGYYSYELGSWHMVVLNSNCTEIGGCQAGSPQQKWLANDLAAHPTKCTLAYYHHPRWNIGEHAAEGGQVQGLWQTLYDAGVDVVLNGHDHDYQRWAPMNGSGAKDTALGIREFVVGTGGRDHYSFIESNANVEVKDNTTYGVIKMKLRANDYDWEFVPIAGQTFTDKGTGTCH